MERVILVLALLAGLHLILSFLRSAAQTVQDWLLQKPAPTVSARAGEGGQDRLAAVPRSGLPAPESGIEPDRVKSGEASFEVIA
jgi:hypothetical protein